MYICSECGAGTPDSHATACPYYEPPDEDAVWALENAMEADGV